MTEKNLLVLGDSPTLQSGFACVTKNLLPWWHGSGRFNRIDVWGIGHEGWPHDLPYRIFPAQSYACRNWYEDANLERFLGFLDFGDYTHLWMVQDTFHIARMAKTLGEVCRRKKIRSLLYYPVDAAVDPVWAKALRAVDVPVAYTDYGFAEFRKHHENLKKVVLPHGTNLDHYFPSAEDRAKGRQLFTDSDGRKVVGPDDFLILNVSAHQKRKGLAQTLQVFKKLKDMVGDQYGRLKLYMHMPVTNRDEQSDLRQIAMQLDLRDCVLFAEGMFVGNASRIKEDELRLVYNAADLLLTTTLGEGWGLPITEAMACGVPVAGPRHTSVAELLNVDSSPFKAIPPELSRGVGFSCSSEIVLPLDNMRLRPVTDVSDAAREIADAMACDPASPLSLQSRATRAMDWVNLPEFRWGNIAGEWLNLMDGISLTAPDPKSRIRVL